MNDDFLASKEFASLMHRHIQECIELILSKNKSFEILANMHFIEFNPPLPKSIKAKREIALFTISGYALQSAKLINNSLIFNSIFGDENFATSVKIDFSGILRINIQDAMLLVNFSIPPITTLSHNTDDEIQKSTDIFKSNPKNKNVFKS